MLIQENTAYFVRFPHRIDDLWKIHNSQERKHFFIEKTIELIKYDYENFITDLCADRWFIEDNKAICKADENGVWHCIFVKQKGKSDGILVMSEGEVFPKYAAYFNKEIYKHKG